MSLSRQSAIITEDVALADADLQAAQSIVAQQLRAVTVIPLYSNPRASSAESAMADRVDPARSGVANTKGAFLDVLYLDSRRPAAFSKLDRQILDALAFEAASVLDN